MYDNIGKKIKTLTKIVTIVLSVASIIAAIASIVGGVLWGLIFFFMPILFWISSFFMYGFGELIDKVTKIEQALNNTKQINFQKEEKTIITQKSDNSKETVSEKKETSNNDMEDIQNFDMLSETKKAAIRLLKNQLKDGLISFEQYEKQKVIILNMDII